MCSSSDCQLKNIFYSGRPTWETQTKEREKGEATRHGTHWDGQVLFYFILFVSVCMTMIYEKGEW
jgi:hypothetical protein